MRNVTNEIFEEAWKNEDNKKIILSVCNKYRKILPKEELTFRGQMGLWNCLRDHDKDKGNKFTTSLYEHVKWQCLRGIRDSNKDQETKPLPYDDCGYINVPDEVMYVRDCLDTLPPEYSEIIKNYHYNNMTLREIGRMFGYTQVTAMYKLRKAEKEFCRLYDMG